MENNLKNNTNCSLCHTLETNTTLQINEASIKVKLKKNKRVDSMEERCHKLEILQWEDETLIYLWGPCHIRDTEE